MFQTIQKLTQTIYYTVLAELNNKTDLIKPCIWHSSKKGMFIFTLAYYRRRRILLISAYDRPVVLADAYTSVGPSRKMLLRVRMFLPYHTGGRYLK